VRALGNRPRRSAAYWFGDIGRIDVEITIFGFAAILPYAGELLSAPPVGRGLGRRKVSSIGSARTGAASSIRKGRFPNTMQSIAAFARFQAMTSYWCIAYRGTCPASGPCDDGSCPRVEGHPASPFLRGCMVDLKAADRRVMGVSHLRGDRGGRWASPVADRSHVGTAFARLPTLMQRRAVFGSAGTRAAAPRPRSDPIEIGWVRRRKGGGT